MDKIKTKTAEKVKRTQTCSCKNSCQRKTGPKRAGCPCKDEGLYCSEQCECGTNAVVCKNNQQDCHTKKTPVVPDDLRLVTGLSNMRIIDESNSDISDGETSKSEQERPSYPAEGQNKGGNILSQSLLKTVHKINNGYALVIHNKYFHKLRTKESSQKDLNTIKIFCTEAGLTLDIQENLKVKDIRAHCRKLTDDENIFQNYDGFVCFILSYENSSGICGVYDETISVQEIVTYFEECDDLLGKPKLFFIQACRRIDRQKDDQEKDQEEDDGNEDDHKQTLCPPDSSDILIAHSTIKDNLSYRDIYTGSWFIQSLMKQFKAHAQSLHLIDIMKVVNEDIAGSYGRQVPIQVSTLTKFVYFKMATDTVVKVMQAKNAERLKVDKQRAEQQGQRNKRSMRESTCIMAVTIHK